MSERVLAIDPGNTESAWAIVDSETCRPIVFGKHPNPDVLRVCYGEHDFDRVAIEMIASYGMPVGAEVFETCVWIGRFVESTGYPITQVEPDPELILRREVKIHHCHDSRAKDGNIIQALVDRFAPGQPNRGKGTKATPGFFYGFAADVWQAFALAVFVADQLEGRSV